MSTTSTRENPARSAEIIGEVTHSDHGAVDAVVRDADRAQREWSTRPAAERAEALLAAADAVTARVEEIAGLVARETGKVLGDARGEAGFSAAVLRWYAERCVDLLADKVRDDERGRLVIRHRPFGVVAAITPWNAPLILSVLKIAPALAAGNAIVIKPSPLAPFGVSAMVEAIAGAVPADLIQVVHGEAETATALVEHALVRRVAFTGGDAAGRAIAALAGRALTPSVMELGGNDPAIVLPDADLDESAYDRMVMATFATSGQVCMAIKRLYVPAAREREVLDGIRAAALRVLRVGDPLHPGVSMGPVVSAASAARLEALLAGGVGRGGAAETLGTVDPDTDLSGGYFVLPTLVVGLADTDPLVAEEQFGPILPVLSYEHLDDVLARANAGELGLGASVWSSDEAKAFEVAARLEAGFTFVNTHNRTGMALDAPFGGVKNSGWGREYGTDGLAEYVQPCVIHAPAAFREGGAGGGAGAGAADYPTG